VELTEEQQLALAVLVVILVAISMLYCLGLASLALRDSWEELPLPWNGTSLPEPDTGMMPRAPAKEPILPTRAEGLLPLERERRTGLTKHGFASIIDRLNIDHRPEKERLLWTPSPC
jgi:hypothetical protein